MSRKKSAVVEPVAQQEQPKQKGPAIQYHQGPNGQLYRMSFGMPVPPGTEDCMTAAWAFVHYEEAMERGCSTPRAELFWWIVDFFWGEGARKRFIRHPWAEKMTLYACDHAYLGISGAASSGKSDWGAVWALVNWWCDPINTKVLITSTTMKDAQKRIWGSVRDYYYGGKHKMPGKYVHSFGQIRTSEKASDNTASDKSGLELIPCSQSKEAQAIGRLIGMKAPRMIIVADELPELTDSILEAVETNLSANPSFQMIGLGNHVSWLDPFGKFVTPKNGINSVTVEDEDWETSRGWCVHFDGTKSPNFEYERDMYPIYGRKQKREHDKLPTTSIGFWRFCRSFPPADSEAGQIYSEIEIISNGGVTKPHYKGPLVRLAALDPAFTTGGDRAYGIQGTLGETVDGRMVLAVTLHKPFYEDVTDKEVPRNYQIARQFAQWCKENGIQPEDTGVDSTGAGIPFAEILMQEWSPRIQRIAFGGAASDLPASATDPTPGKEAYANRVSELWYQGVYYVRSGQLGDIPRNIVKEMCCRRYIHVKGATTRIKVESKEEMKKRLKESPDASDSLFILLEVARIRHQFFPEAFGAALKEQIAKEEDSADSSNVLDDYGCLLSDESSEGY